MTGSPIWPVFSDGLPRPVWSADHAIQSPHIRLRRWPSSHDDPKAPGGSHLGAGANRTQRRVAWGLLPTRRHAARAHGGTHVDDVDRCPASAPTMNYVELSRHGTGQIRRCAHLECARYFFDTGRHRDNRCGSVYPDVRRTSAVTRSAHPDDMTPVDARRRPGNITGAGVPGVCPVNHK